MFSIAQAKISNGQSLWVSLDARRAITIIETHRPKTTKGAIAAIRHLPAHCLIAAIGKAALAADIVITMMDITRFQNHSADCAAA